MSSLFMKVKSRFCVFVIVFRAFFSSHYKFIFKDRPKIVLFIKRSRQSIIITRVPLLFIEPLVSEPTLFVEIAEPFVLYVEPVQKTFA